ncbi:PHD finger protein 12 [Nymphon striatum]|nr:PHD finger protein 12 [Nymphon striatum]
MNTVVEYDLDTSGGLMPQIQALIAPPVNEESFKKVKRERRRELGQSYYRKHGRAVNHDYCDSCRESGSLLCCDRCPAAFHLQCLDPPIDEDALPSGEWMCHRCAVAPREIEDDQVSTCSEQSSGRNSHISDKNESNEMKISVDEVDKEDFNYQDNSFIGSREYDRERELAVGVALRKGRRQCTIQKKKGDNNTVNRELPPGSNGSNGGNNNVCKTGMKPIAIELEENETPLQTLIKVASVMNPKQFHLPPELTCTTHLPGTRKRWKPRDSRQKKVPYELDNGLVPLPAILCQECDQSCKKAPLLKCDYCPYLYHLDCLNPPLTVMPTGRWMCPAHPEHIIDQKLLMSASLSERIKLRNEFAGPISQDAIKLQFLKKIQRKNPPFRYKRTLPTRTRVKVPNAIKELYKNPPPLLPRPSDPIIISNHDLGIKTEQQNASLSQDQELWLQSILSLHCKIADKLSLDKTKLNELNKTDLEKQTGKKNDVEPMDVDGNSKENSKDTNAENRIDVNSNVPKAEDKIPKDSGSKDAVDAKTSVIKPAFDADKSSSVTKENLIREKDNTPSNKVVEDTKFRVSGDTKILEKSKISYYKIPEDIDDCFTNGDINISKLDERIIKLLALQHLRQIFSHKLSFQNGAESTVDESTKKKIHPPGADTDLCLTNYGHCNYISGKHAAIFYDETTKHYELLNYSEHGTTVDNVLYSCDFSDKKPPAPAQPNTIVASVRSIIDKNRNKKYQIPVKSKPCTMSSCSGQKRKSCGCKASSSSMIGGSGAGWEGTAILHHGSHIKCGCLQFVFSIIDGSPNGYVSVSDPSLKSGR